MRASLACLATSIAAVLGCGGGGAPEPMAPGADQTPAGSAPAMEVGSTTDARAELDRAEKELEAALGARSTYAQPVAPGAQPGTAPPPASGTTQLSSDPCAVACSALASMARSADRLCGLTGPDDPACHDALGRVEAATARVRAACPGCPA